MAQPCGYGCGKPWIPWSGSRLRGHARCYLPAPAGDALLERYEADPRLTLDVLAAELQVARPVVVAVLAAARERRAARRADAA